jgi:hypothetical protein
MRGGYPPLGDDVLRGAKQIALFWAGRDDRKAVKNIYHTIEKTNSIPTYLWGSMLCARKSTLYAHVWAQEKQSMDPHQRLLVRLHTALSAVMLHLYEKQPYVEGADRLLLAIDEASHCIEQLLQTEVHD